jgi:hypothetical protein
MLSALQTAQKPGEFPRTWTPSEPQRRKLTVQLRRLLTGETHEHARLTPTMVADDDW